MEDDPKIELESAALSLITAPFVLSCVSTIPPFQRSIELKQPVPGFGFETNPTAFEVPSIFGSEYKRLSECFSPWYSGQRFQYRMEWGVKSSS